MDSYKNWLDSLRSRISQCLEQIEFLKLMMKQWPCLPRPGLNRLALSTVPDR